MNNWFEVDKEGLAQLMAGKPKSYILRELIQNAWDEDITYCRVTISHLNNKCTIVVEDDNPDGFKDLKHAYTLFADTYKRDDVSKRGRFNTGEKMVFAVCEKATVLTTKGCIIFDVNGRNEYKNKRAYGSEITVTFNCSKMEYTEILTSVSKYLVPKGIRFTVNNEIYKFKKPVTKFKALLITETRDSKSGFLKRTKRSGMVHVVTTSDQAYLYEMGIPVQPIDGDFHLDIQQKVPLDQARESVLPSFLKELYAVILPQLIKIDRLTEDNVGDVWVNVALENKDVNKETVQEVITKRYGDKVVVADNFDPNSIDDAISEGYTVIRGTEFSKGAWKNIKKHELVPSSSKLFGHGRVKESTVIEPTLKQSETAEYARKIAKRCLNIEISVKFVRDRDLTFSAQFSSHMFNGYVLTFNLASLPSYFFDEPVSERTTDLIVHELGHYGGKHTEGGYHKQITKLAGQLTMMALNEPEFFEVN